MITESDPAPPQVEHLFVRGLRFEGELQYQARASGNRKAKFREIKAPMSGHNGGRAWCAAVAGDILGIWPLRERAKSHEGWTSADAETVQQLIHQGGLAMVQLGDRYSTWWALVTGMERDQIRQTVIGLLLLDVTQGLPWGVGYNARVGGIQSSVNGPLKWRGIDGGGVSVQVLRWIELEGSRIT